MQRLLIGSLLSCLVAIGSVYAATGSISSPPKCLSEIQKGEWQIGIIVGIGKMCGSYDKAREIATFMKKSPHYRGGQSAVMAFDRVGCGDVPKYLDDVLGQKDFWQLYMNVTYPEKLFSK